MLDDTTTQNETYFSKNTTSFLVSLQEAKDIASRKLPIQLDPCGEGIKFPIFTVGQLDDVITIFDKNNIPAMYLFNADTEGFLLLSASKLEEPFLAYSTEAPLDLADMPRDLAVWIDLGVTKISQLNRLGYYYDIGVYDAWRTLGFVQPVHDWVIEGPGDPIPLPTFTREDVGCPYIEPSTKTGPLLGNIMWGQREGYNEEQDIFLGCGTGPDDDRLPLNNKYYAGCVMVAFGQIMKYYDDFGNFSNLVLNNGVVAERVTTTTDGVNVSKVLRGIYDVTLGSQQSGTKTRGCSGTGAFIYNTAMGISSPFTIGGQIFQYSSANYYNTHNSVVAFQNIVENHRPIVLSGYGVDTKKINKNITINYKQKGLSYSTNLKLGSGHAWVSDGYQEEVQKVKVTNNATGGVNYEIEHKREFWHMNWGWHIMNGNFASGNGWYRDGLFKPKSGINGNNLIDYNDIVGYDIDGDGVNDGTYHQGYYYYRSMVVNIIP